MNEGTAVQLRNVTKKIRGKTIVDDLTFDVPRGEVFGLLGPNGAGKTTTIRMMVGLMRMTGGDIRIEGKRIDGQFSEAIRHVGAIVENPEMYKFLSGYLNLVHFARMSPGISERRIREVVGLVGLENRIHDKVKTYSLGMRQRLGVAQALLHKPSVLILDEPTNGLDPAGIRELRDYLRRLAKEQGISVIVSSHLLSEMELMCDRVAIIQQGRLVDVKTIGRGPAEGERIPVRFEVDEPLHAIEILGVSHRHMRAKRVPQGLELQLERGDIPEITTALACSGIKIYAVRPVVKTLEDTFLEMTGGGTIA